jgi:GNAT superfamily N-acetyltransferase
MCDEWMPSLTLSLAADQYQQLPRSSAYQYDYLRGTAILTPRPKHYHGTLDLSTWRLPAFAESSPPVKIRSASVDDHTTLAPLFADAFDRVQPFAGLTAERRLTAARLALERTVQGGDGPWIAEASFRAVHEETGSNLGAILITLVPGGDPADPENYRWQEPPPPDLRGRELGQPHLTWVFVSPLWKSRGFGSALLDRSVKALRELGYQSLWTTFMMGNDASMLWHWCNGFALAPHPMSRRRDSVTSRNSATGRR